jgi:DNA repair protein RecO (recombination protein O)
VAKGVKKPTSQFRPVLLPLQPLLLSWGGDAEVRTLKAAQWQGGHVMPTGEALISGSYLNELLMRLLARDDPHPGLFDHYVLAVQLLAERTDVQQLILRAFELLLLRTSGCCPTWPMKAAVWRRWTRRWPTCCCPTAACGRRTPTMRTADGCAVAGLQQALDEADGLIATCAPAPVASSAAAAAAPAAALP